MLLRWNPANRLSLQHVARYLRGHFDFPLQQGDRPAQKDGASPAGKFGASPAGKRGISPAETSETEGEDKVIVKKSRASSSSSTRNEPTDRSSHLKPRKLTRCSSKCSSLASADGITGSQPADGKCHCSGNCGREPCQKNLNCRRKETGSPQPTCVRVAAEGSKSCKRCQCETAGCTKPMYKETRRWCKQHGRLLRN